MTHKKHNKKQSKETNLVLIGGLLTLVVVAAFAAYAADKVQANAKQLPAAQVERTTDSSSAQLQIQADSTTETELLPEDEPILQDDEEPEPIILEAAESVDLENVSISLGEMEITCTWESQTATSYRISIGTKAKATDVIEWMETSDTSHTFSPIRIAPKTSYFCNVEAFSASGVSSQVQSIKSSS